VKRSPLILLAIVFFKMPSAWADDQNYQNYVLGEKAAGMGGAYTALSESPEGTFYNPGGIVFADKSRISLSVNALRLTRGNIKNAVSIGNIREDLALSAFQVIPASAVSLTLFNTPWDKDKKDEKKNALAWSLYTPDAVQYIGRGQVSDGSTNAFFTYRLDDTLTMTGMSYARRIHDRFGLGLSLFYLFRNYDNESFVTAATATNFVQTSNNVEYSYGGLRLVAGIKWRVHPKWHAGLSIAPYSIKLHGSGKSFSSRATEGAVSSTNPTHNVFEGLSVNLPLPMKMSAGIGYQPTEKLTLAGDVNLYLPNSFTAVADPQGRVGSSRIHQNLVINSNVGCDYRWNKKWRTATGFFTNFSAADPVAVGSGSASKIDYYGGTLSLAYDLSPFSYTVGTQIAGGSGVTLVANAVTRYTIIRYTVMIGTAFKY